MIVLRLTEEDYQEILSSLYSTQQNMCVGKEERNIVQKVIDKIKKQYRDYKKYMAQK